MRKLRVLDLFSGIGGFSLGLERTGGFETVAFCEIEEFPRRVLAKHWPEVPCFDDVRTLNAAALAERGIAVDVICGGFPCQDISFAGRGAGLAGERSGLFYEVSRLVGELGPRLLILENVAALLGRGLDQVLGTLASLGYDAEWHCIPASAIGAPHRRDRIWIVAHARGEQHQGRGVEKWGARAARLLETVVADANGCLHPRGVAGGEADGPSGRSEGRDQGQGQAPHGQRVRAELGAGGADLADASGEGLSRRQLEILRGAGRRQEGRATSQRRETGRGDTDWWSAEPDVGRVAHGVPARVDRLKSLGNAVVPQIPELIGRAILAAERERLAA